MTTFAAFKTKNRHIDIKIMGFFMSIWLLHYCKIKGYSNPMMPIFLIEYGVLGRTKKEASSLSLFYNFNFSFITMTKKMENYSVANNSTTAVTSAHETCKQFIAFIRERYPQLQSPHFKLTRGGKLLTIRAGYHRRRIFAYGRDFDKTMAYFTKQCIRKISLEKYYTFVAEAKEKKPLEPFFVGLRCFIRKQE